MDQRSLLTLFDYGAWADKRVLNACRALDASAWQAMPGDQQNLRSILTHMLRAAMTWRTRFESGDPEARATLRPEEFPTPDALAEAWSAEEQRMRDWLGSLSAKQLAAPHNDRPHLPLGEFILQPLLHSAQHRAEVALMLTELGHSPGNLDFLVFAAARQG